MQQNDIAVKTVKRAAKGDRAAMSELYSKTCQRVYRTILGLVRDEQTAEDLTQDTYVAAFSGLKKLEDPSRFQPWLISTAVHKSKNHLRRSRPVLYSELENTEELDNLADSRAEASPEISLERRETTRIVREAMGELSESQRLAVELYYYDQLTTTEIARSLEIPQNTVKTQLYYARKKLEAALRRMRENGVELGDLTALGCLCFLRQMPEEPMLPPQRAEEMLAKLLPKVPNQVVARTGAQLFKGVLGKIAVSAAAVAVVGGVAAGGVALSKMPKRGDVRPSEPSVTVQLEEFTAGPFSEDYEDLWNVLENDYPLLPWLERQGMDLAAIREEFRAQAAEAETVEDFMKVTSRLLENRLGASGYLHIVQPNEYQQYYAQLVPEGRWADKDEQLAQWRAVLTDDRLSEIYVVPEPDAADPISSSAYVPYVRWRRNEKAIQITFYTCYFNERDRDVVTKALAKYPEAENLIIDIRNNSGGNDAYWVENLIEPLGGDWEFSYRGYYRDTPEIAPFYEKLENYAVSELADAPAWAEELGLDRAFVAQTKIDTGAPATDLKLWVLTNNKTMGSGAWIAAFAQAAGWATVVGEHTSANTGFGWQPAMVVLPKSGLLLEFTEAIETPRGDLQNETGIVPDVVCDPNDALDVCLELIRNGTEGKTD